MGPMDFFFVKVKKLLDHLDCRTEIQLVVKEGIAPDKPKTCTK
jgi:hypothetical protein